MLDFEFIKCNSQTSQNGFFLYLGHAHAYDRNVCLSRDHVYELLHIASSSTVAHTHARVLAPFIIWGRGGVSTRACVYSSSTVLVVVLVMRARAHDTNTGKYSGWRSLTILVQAVEVVRRPIANNNIANNNMTS